jgi:hypothetical protein
MSKYTKFRDLPIYSESDDAPLSTNLHIPNSASKVAFNTTLIRDLNNVIEYDKHVIGQYDGLPPSEMSLGALQFATSFLSAIQ